MLNLEVLLNLPPKIAAGLISGELTRWGGVIRNSRTGQIVAFLREGGQIASNADLAIGLLKSLTLASNQSSGILQGIITAHAQYAAARQIRLLGSELRFVRTLGLMNIAMTGLNLLALMAGLKRLEAQLNQIHERIIKEFNLDRMVDLKGALNLAKLAEELNEAVNRRDFARKAIGSLDRGKQHILSNYSVLTSGNANAQQLEAAQAHLFLAMQADIVRVRCMMEIDEAESAVLTLESLVKDYEVLTRELIDLWLGEHRAVYFHPLMDKETVQDYVLVEQWLRGNDDVLLDLLEELRQDFWNREVDRTVRRPKPFKSILHEIFRVSSRGDAGQKKVLLHIFALENAEVLIENHRRLQGFAFELQELQRRNRLARPEERISFSEWNNLVDSDGFKLSEHDDYVLLVDPEILQKAESLGW